MELAATLGIGLRRVPGAGQSGDHPGGALVRGRQEEMIFLDTTAAVEDQIDVVAAAIRGRPELQERFLPPELRELLEAQPPAE